MPSPLTLPVRYGRRQPPCGVPVHLSLPLMANAYRLWPLNEGAGGTITDAVQRGGGTLVGPSYPTWGASPFGRCLTFPGGNSAAAQNAVNLGPLTPGPTGMSVVAWVRTTASASSSTAYHILSADPATSARWWQFRMLGTGVLQFIPFNSANGAVTVATTKTINDGRWHQVAGTWVAAGAVLAYIDGVQAASGSLGGAMPTTSTHDAYLGGIPGGSMPASTSWTGDIAAPAVWSRPLAASEISSLYVRPYSMY